MLIAQSTIKPLHSYLFSTLAEYDKCSPLLYICCSEGGCYSEDVLVLGVRNPQSTACDVWCPRFQD
jgi:hypothetical protein